MVVPCLFWGTMTNSDLDLLAAAVRVARHESALSETEALHLGCVIERLRGISYADLDDVSRCLLSGQKSLAKSAAQLAFNRILVALGEHPIA